MAADVRDAPKSVNTVTTGRNLMVSARDSFDEQEVLTYLDTLSQVQGELLELLVSKREAISTGEVDQLAELGVREIEVQDKMAQLQVRRS